MYVYLTKADTVRKTPLDLLSIFGKVILNVTLLCDECGQALTEKTLP